MIPNIPLRTNSPAGSVVNHLARAEPTPDPLAFLTAKALRPRDSTPKTCGYWNANFDEPYTCGGSYGCAVVASLWGCCSTDSTGNFYTSDLSQWGTTCGGGW